LTVRFVAEADERATSLPNGASASALVEMLSDERHTFGAEPHTSDI
jgi:hypothetical protein